MKTISLSLLFAFAFHTSGEEFSGKMFGLGKKGDAPMYTQKVWVEHQPDGTTVTTADMSDGAGDVIIHERAVYTGATFISQEIDNKLEHKEYRATLKDKTATFEAYNEQKQLLSSHHETIHGPMVTGATAENFIRDNWQSIMNGQRVDFRFAVFERQETIGFSFKKKTEADVDGKSAVVLLMRPTSFFVAMIVSPIEISVDKDSKTIIHYKGRTAIKTDKNKNLEAEIVYDRQIPSISRATASEKAN